MHEEPHAQGTGPDRGHAASKPRSAPVDHRQVVALAEQVDAVFGPALRAEHPDPLAQVGGMIRKAVASIAHLLNPAPVVSPEQPFPGGRAGLLATVAESAADIRHLALVGWAQESTAAELVRVTEDELLSDADLGGAVVESAKVTVTMPDEGGTQVVLELRRTRDGLAEWTSDAPLPLATIDATRHLLLHALLSDLGEVITHALHPDLIGE